MSKKGLNKFDKKFGLLFFLLIWSIEHPWLIIFVFLIIGYKMKLFKLNYRLAYIKEWRTKDKFKAGFFIYICFYILSLMVIENHKVLYQFLNTLSVIMIYSLLFYGLYKLYKFIKRFFPISVHTKASIHEVDQLEGTEFERFLAPLFEKQGYRTIITKASGDFGADLILKKGKDKVVVQAKRYDSKVGNDAINEVVGAAGYYNATKKMVITNNYFRENAKILANCNKVQLIDRDGLIQMINKYNHFIDSSINSRFYKRRNKKQLINS